MPQEKEQQRKAGLLQKAREPVAKAPAPVKKTGPAVLFVCTGNICRSPMAAALFKLNLKEHREDWDSWKVDSAGTWAEDGAAVSRNSRFVIAERGIDIAGHRARTVTGEMLESYDLILTMEPGHKEALRIEFPSVADRVYMLSEMYGDMEPVKDPYGGPLVEYQKTANTIETMIKKGMQKILLLAAEK